MQVFHEGAYGCTRPFGPCRDADHAAGEKALAPLRSFGRPLSDGIVAQPYVKLQTRDDQRTAHGLRFYSKSGFVASLDPAIDALSEACNSADPAASFFIQLSGGAIGRVAPDATAFPNRKPRYWAMMNTRSKDAADDAARIGSVRTAWKSVEPITSGFYVNSMSEEQYRKVDANYGPNYPRLVALKNKYDPGNQFRLNANVQPTARS